MRAAFERWIPQNSVRRAWFVVGVTVGFFLVLMGLVALASLIFGERPVVLGIIAALAASFGFMVLVMPIGMTILGLALRWDVHNLPRGAEVVVSGTVGLVGFTWMLFLAAAAVDGLRSL